MKKLIEFLQTQDVYIASQKNKLVTLSDILALCNNHPEWNVGMMLDGSAGHIEVVVPGNPTTSDFILLSVDNHYVAKNNILPDEQLAIKNSVDLETLNLHLHSAEAALAWGQN